MSSDPPKPIASVDLDKLAVDQALVDAEVANARVRDLTFRLIEATETIAQLREALAASELEVAELEAERVAIESTHAYRWARRVWALVHSIRG